MTSEEEFIGLIKINKGIIYKVSNSYCSTKDDRDDLAQEIVYNLWKSFRSYNKEYKFSTWMYRIALNVAISFYRKEKKMQHENMLPDRLMVFDNSDEMESEADRNLQALQIFISELKEIDKAIILLYLEDKSHKEIAHITGFTLTNVGSRINRIKEKLRTRFTNY